MTPDFEVSVATEIKEIEEKKPSSQARNHRAGPAAWRRWLSVCECDFKGAERLPSLSPNRSPPANIG